MVDEIKITLKDKALEKFHWIKQEGDFRTSKEVVDFVFNTAIEVLKKTANGREAIFKRVDLIKRVEKKK